MIKQYLFRNWHLMRWLRLSLGIFIGVQAFQTHDLLSGAISLFFLFQAVTNTGCCGANQCNIPDQINSSHQEEKIIFEEIKNK